MSSTAKRSLSMSMLARRFTLGMTVSQTSGAGAISIAFANPSSSQISVQRRFASGMTTSGGSSASRAAGAMKNTPEKALKAAIESELKYEKEMTETDPIEVPSEVIEHFKAHGLTISKDNTGDALVVLSGEKNGTKLSLAFDVRQVYLNELGDDDDQETMDNEESNEEEQEDDQEGDEIEADEDADMMDEGLEPVAAKLVLTRGNSSLSFEISLSSEGVEVHSMHTGALPLNAELYTSDVFTGPNYVDLSTDLQEAVSGYLETFGITGELADVLRSYMDVKERKEYVAWLSTVRDFFK
ncbi:Mitochondrial acidic protein mam33 [Mitosporidium daphniae]|uniref:Regulatory protein suaprga1 n=1 Tax=Mitosporidium daphniae TaxID=1485682 RepID=A0A098VQW7_9MICR|nr:regulatory protein suaprga1 [Mitosporidium daphniae]XP_013238719.1 regulatory protein suaprga1 [Mitosporidium daphniae]KGG51340.1 regulatory protein suaprga1 [Mitosporidium daphniae]KGG52283.1 regulatory protein suaprga1 [Mitosporidium daphniae]|eukprot:XP_013237767.1 regulatory protein suaprga1 [Mitosporidium daphniae]